MKNLLQKIGRLGTLVTAITAGLTVMPAWAEDVYVTSYYGLAASTDLTPCPHSCSTGFSTFGASAASSSTATPVPVVPAAGRRSIFGLNTGATWSVTPTNATYAPVSGGPYNFTALQNLGVYKIYVTKGQSNNGSTNIIVTMTATGGSLADTNGVGSSAIDLDVYQKGKPDHVWVHVGYITNSVHSPTITFTHTGGLCNNTDAVNNNAQRWYADAVRFEFIDDCSGVADQLSIAGPLVSGQTFVNVSGVTAGATNVTVYAGGAYVGEANSETGFTGGTLAVTTAALFKGQVITATQTRNGCTSTLPTTGPVVGGGPNVQVKAFLSLLKNPAFTGPAGTGTTNATGTQYFVKATGLVGGFGTAPMGGEEIFPSQCWQTLTFSTNDSNVGGTSALPVENSDPFCALDGILFAMNWTDLDSGPYDIYIDEIKNGDVVIEDFEAYVVGSTNFFSRPSSAVTPTPSSTYLSGTDSSVISSDNSFDGSKSCRIRWQWADSAFDRWVRIVANATPGKQNPQFDVSKPITIRYLVLPVGQTDDQLSFPVVPVNQVKTPGQNVTFSVEAAGSGPFTYQWQFEGNDIAGETTSTYSKSNVQVSDSGSYSVVVAGTSGCNATLSASLTVTEDVPPPTLNYSVSGGQITFTWDGSFTLQAKETVDGATWNDVSSSTGHQESLSLSTTKFFRLRQ